MKKIIAIMMCVMLLGLTACGGSTGIKPGTYNGSAGGGSRFEFRKDGTCLYSYEELKEDLEGTYDKMDDGRYEIILNGLNYTLYGKVTENGEVIVSSDSSQWENETFTRE